MELFSDYKITQFHVSTTIADKYFETVCAHFCYLSLEFYGSATVPMLETIQKLNENFNCHFSGFKQTEERLSSLTLSEYFLIGLCKETT